MVVWFITGASSGIGKAIAEAALKNGDKVIASSRNSSKLADLQDKGAITIDFDVNLSQEELVNTIDELIKNHGSIDVVVNNSGYAQFGSIEEAGVELLEKQFKTNVYGPIKVSNAILPHFRAKKSGIILNIGSRAAYDTIPFAGLYDSSKAALQNLSLTLDKEISKFNLRSILIEPGMFRTKFLSSLNESDLSFPAKFEDYESDRVLLEKVLKEFDSKQPGDPGKLASNLIDLVHKKGSFKGKEIPSIVTFGADSIDSIREYSQFNLQRIEEMKDLILSTQGDWA
ncbi:Piso0_005902 [Millerozyma farinosa CBS 7064]|uniref:Piso0_005902 protein n=1 Tax=Pichia sorbitophila (strain ATCC MYA-4447 / BCRC 22081 / CBS 7064 / NBRC 10061 / NRRL Y-12695) TaxID=559304 RepID=G8Y382_PICSO|nr:Piso0_005902 [Millerozyma farinosa CBS 7064]